MLDLQLIRQEISALLAWRHLPVPSGALVLDVGSGDNPHVRADVLCDAHLHDSGEREGKFDLLIDERPFVFADACRLPFRDKVFDFVVCRHLLEHMQDPAALLEELMRVGKAGYIETPSVFLETLFGWPFHTCTVELKDGCLHITPKRAEGRYGIIPPGLTNNRHWRQLVLENRGAFFVSYYWKGKIAYRIEGAFPTRTTPPPPAEDFREIPRPSFRRRMRGLVTRGMRRLVAHGRFEPEQMLACPACRGKIGLKDGRADCPACGTSYPVIGERFFKFL